MVCVIWNAKTILPSTYFASVLLTRMIGDAQYDKLTKKIEKEGVDLNTTYEELSDENTGRSGICLSGL